MANYGIELMGLLDAMRDDFGSHAEFLGEFSLGLGIMWEELVEWRVEQTAGSEQTLQRGVTGLRCKTIRVKQC